MAIKETFIRLGFRIPSVLYEAEIPAEKSRIALIVMHSDEDYLTFPFGLEMAKRGYRVLCASVADKSGSLDQKMLNLKLAVKKLRDYSDVSKVVLMGHSGGGTLMTAYQNIAENGVKTFQGSEKLVKCSDTLENLLPADGIMLLDSNFGIAAMSLFSLDPAVTNEDSGQTLNEELNLFNPANGFNPEGSTYSAQFIDAFQKAQGARNNRLIKKALERLASIEKGKGKFTDDEPFIVPGAEQGFLNNKLYAQDIRLMSHTKKEWPLLKANGSTTTTIIRSVRKPENHESLTGSYHNGALITTVRNYLNSYAVKTLDNYGYNEDSVYGIDWSSSYNCPPGNIRKVTAPLLIMGMTGNWEYLASETIYENAISKDKTLVFVEGASHLFTTASHCEKFPGEFGDTQKTTCDYADKWLSQNNRF
jgi:hypothetical protein